MEAVILGGGKLKKCYHETGVRAGKTTLPLAWDRARPPQSRTRTRWLRRERGGAYSRVRRRRHRCVHLLGLCRPGRVEALPAGTSCRTSAARPACSVAPENELARGDRCRPVAVSKSPRARSEIEDARRPDHSHGAQARQLREPQMVDKATLPADALVSADLRAHQMDSSHPLPSHQ